MEIPIPGKKSMSESRALFIAITGGIGSGKSTVAAIIRKHGYSVISADEVARNVMENDEYVKNALIVEYGNATFLPNGKLNTEHISALVFSSGNKEKIQKLNSIVHPSTLDAIIDMAEQLDEQVRERRWRERSSSLLSYLLLFSLLSSSVASFPLFFSPSTPAQSLSSSPSAQSLVSLPLPSCSSLM